MLGHYNYYALANYVWICDLSKEKYYEKQIKVSNLIIICYIFSLKQENNGLP